MDTVPHHIQRQYCAFLPKTDIFCLLGCSVMGRADTDANIAGRKMYCKRIWKEYEMSYL